MEVEGRAHRRVRGAAAGQIVPCSGTHKSRRKGWAREAAAERRRRDRRGEWPDPAALASPGHAETGSAAALQAQGGGGGGGDGGDAPLPRSPAGVSWAGKGGRSRVQWAGKSVRGGVLEGCPAPPPGMLWNSRGGLALLLSPGHPPTPPHTCSKSIFSEESKQRGVPTVAPRLPTAQDPFHLVTDRRAAAHARAPGIR